jgi:hypothetical protein
VLGGVGVVLVARLAGDLAAGARRPVAIGAGAVLIAACIPLLTTPVTEARATFPAASRAVSTLNTLTRVVAAVGGHDAVYPCPSSFTAINHSVQTAMAWKLRVDLEKVGTKMTEPGLDFIGPHNPTDGGPAPVDPRLTHQETVAQLDGWRVLRLTDPRLHTTACVGR